LFSDAGFCALGHPELASNASVVSCEGDESRQLRAGPGTVTSFYCAPNGFLVGGFTEVADDKLRDGARLCGRSLESRYFGIRATGDGGVFEPAADATLLVAEVFANRVRACGELRQCGVRPRRASTAEDDDRAKEQADGGDSAHPLAIGSNAHELYRARRATTHGALRRVNFIVAIPLRASPAGGQPDCAPRTRTATPYIARDVSPTPLSCSRTSLYTPAASGMPAKTTALPASALIIGHAVSPPSIRCAGAGVPIVTVPLPSLRSCFSTGG